MDARVPCERDVVIASGSTRLAATVCTPPGDGPFAVALFVHGSGPLDRNANMRGQRLEIFNTLAHDLARRGVASVRYDKRGCGRSTGDFLRAGHSDHVADALACVDALLDGATDAACDRSRVFLVGHSEGTIIAARLGVERPSVRGLVLVCPFLERLESALLRQAAVIERELAEMRGIGAAMQRALTRALVGSPTKAQRALLMKVRASTADTLRVHGQPQAAKWLRELLALDPAPIFASVACPALLLGAGKDLQCDPADVTRIAALVRGPVEHHIIDDLTHVLRRCEGQPSLLGGSYLLRAPVDAQLVARVGAWLEARSARS